MGLRYVGFGVGGRGLGARGVRGGSWRELRSSGGHWRMVAGANLATTIAITDHNSRIELYKESCSCFTELKSTIMTRSYGEIGRYQPLTSRGACGELSPTPT